MTRCAGKTKVVVLESNEVVNEYDENHYIISKALYLRLTHQINALLEKLELKKLAEESKETDSSLKKDQPE